MDLYIMHTQYNLIMGGACALQNNCRTNDLILCAEFPIEPRFEENLKKLYRNVWIVQREHFSKKGALRELHLYNLLGKLNFLSESYDNVYIAEEEYFDTYVYCKVKKKNLSSKMHCIEEDVYYSTNQEFNTSCYESIFRKKVKYSPFKFAQKVVRMLLFGKNPYFEEHYFYGGNSNFENIYVNYPNALREQLKNRNGVVKVEPQFIIQSIQMLYGKSPIMKFDNNSYVLILVDLIARFDDVKIVEKCFTEIIDKLNRAGVFILYKYHPLETSSLAAFEKSQYAYKLDSKIPSEKFLIDLMGKRVCVIGNASYSVLLANKVGFSAVTTSKIMGTCNQGMDRAYGKIGIHTPVNYNELIEIVEKVVI